jgi:hypothetical protein
MGMHLINEDEYTFSPNCGILFCRDHTGIKTAGSLMKIKTPMCFIDHTNDTYRFIDYSGWSYSFITSLDGLECNELKIKTYDSGISTWYYTTNQFKQNNTEKLFKPMDKGQKITIFYFIEEFEIHDMIRKRQLRLFLDDINYGSKKKQTEEKSLSGIKKTTNNFYNENYDKRFKKHTKEKTSSNSDKSDDDHFKEKIRHDCNLLKLNLPFTDKELEKAYRESTKRNHSDSSGQNSDEHIIKVKEAYENLRTLCVIKDT